MDLLDSDEDLGKSLSEAAHFQMPHSLRRLFSTILAYCSPANPKILWDKFKGEMSEDFARDSNLSAREVERCCLRSISDFLETLGRSLKEFGLGCLDSTLINREDCSREFYHEINVPVPEADIEAIDLLNDDQRSAFNAITRATLSPTGGAFFVDGPGGTGKTFLYRALLAHIRSRGSIALAVATSGVAASLLPGGRTAHSRFKIPMDVESKTKCRISKQSTLAKLLLDAKLIIWDEVSMARRQLIEAFDDILRDVTTTTIPFGGKVVVFGGDYRQIAPVVVGGSRSDMIDASFASSLLCKVVQKIYLHENMRARDDPAFMDFLLRVGNGTEINVVDDCIQIPSHMLIPFSDAESSLNDLINAVYPSLDFFITNPSLVMNRSLLAPKNDSVDDLNDILITRFPGQSRQYTSIDRTKDPSQQGYYEDFLNSVSVGGLPPHILTLKEGCPIILLRNINPIEGLCNGTRLICRKLGEKIINAEIASGHFKGKQTFIPRIPLEMKNTLKCPIPFSRTQFPVKLCFAMTINKAQGQTLDFVGINLREPVFSHGQLYVALSRARNSDSVKVLIHPPTVFDASPDYTRNVVYKEILSLARGLGC